MKNMIKKALFTLVCTVAFLFVGLVTVKAAELNNTKISGYSAKYKADGSTYYYVNNSIEEGRIVLHPESTFRSTTLGAAYYSASVSVVTCSGEVTNEGCKKWSYYNYSNDAAATMDALKSGLSLDFSKLQPATNLNEVNGEKLGSLNSFYGVENTYFVIVQYTSQKLGFGVLVKETTFDAEVFKVVFRDKVKPIDISGEVENGVTKVTVTSGLPITNVRYFYTSKSLEAGFDFQTQYKSANNGVEVLTEMESDPKLGNKIFKYEFTFKAKDDVNYYVEATDVSDAKAVYDVTNGVTHNHESNDKQPGNVGNTPVGKYILIALLVVLVLSLVLVIVQRIVDYRKKLY